MSNRGDRQGGIFRGASPLWLGFQNQARAWRRRNEVVVSQSEEFALGVLSPGSVSPGEGLGLICIRKIIPNCVLDRAEAFCHSLHEVQGSELGRWRWGGGGDTVTRGEGGG